MLTTQLLHRIEAISLKLNGSINEVNYLRREWPQGLESYLREIVQDLDFLADDLKNIACADGPVLLDRVVNQDRDIYSAIEIGDYRGVAKALGGE